MNNSNAPNFSDSNKYVPWDSSRFTGPVKFNEKFS